MKTNVDKLIGSQIAKIRRECEITQEQLAQLVDVAVETISRVERGVSIPSLRTLEKISDALHIPLKDLFDFEQTQQDKFSSFDKESAKLIAYLKTKKVGDVKMCYTIIKKLFEQIDNNYIPKKS